MAKIYEPEQDSHNTIGNGTIVKGDIISNGDIRIDGQLQGNMQIKGKLVVGQTGRIIGEVDCKNSEISGSIEGKLVVNELLNLRSSAKITGDIITAKLSIEPGASFTGTCNMGGNKQQVRTPAPEINEKQEK